jgi:hypothetical protein
VKYQGAEAIYHELRAHVKGKKGNDVDHRNFGGSLAYINNPLSQAFGGAQAMAESFANDRVKEIDVYSATKEELDSAVKTLKNEGAAAFVKQILDLVKEDKKNKK